MKFSDEHEIHCNYAECSLHIDQIFRKELLTLTLTKVIDNEEIDNLLSFH